MKIIIIMAFALMALTCRSQKQAQSSKDSTYMPLTSFNKDTAAYFDYNFIQHKELYINKPLSVLLKKLETPIVSYINSTTQNNKNIYPYIVFFSYNNHNKYLRKQLQLKPFNLIIKWQNAIPKNIADSLGRKHDSHWTKGEADYFGDQMIGDILRTQYIHPEHYYD